MLVGGNYSHQEEVKTSNGNGFVRWIIILLFILAVGSFIMSSSDNPTPTETKPKENNGEQIRLQRYKKNKPKKGSQQWKDHCELKKKLEKVIDPNCYCECKNDINSIWFNPPENGELGEEWEFIPEIYSEGGSKHFRNKVTGEIVRFDKKHKENGVDHYHRYNLEIKELSDIKKFKNENLYLDICGNILNVNRNDKNHILVLQNSNEYKIQNEELCDE